MALDPGLRTCLRAEIGGHWSGLPYDEGGAVVDRGGGVYEGGWGGRGGCRIKHKPRPNHSVPGCMKNQAIIAPFHEVPPEQISNTCIHSLFYHTHPHYTAFPLIYIL